MYEVNRSVFLLIPLDPFWNWLQDIGVDAEDFTLEDLQADANSYLISPCDDVEQVWEEIESRFEEIFAAELADWCEDESLWPDFHPDIFQEWFDIQLSTIVTDLSAEPLARESFQPITLS
ncbi:hypothetical protein [Neisseria sp. 83E34]|uniref:hypothetical protein n=1 Tax=Neisseria sp. 83E34 TaxID=1692264 RepID=UPI0006CE712A|nr:hypothetical protein [Neisseria sp. 83E34]KPN72108.1 VacJ [Neisseria sp. 83E34]